MNLPRVVVWLLSVGIVGAVLAGFALLVFILFRLVGLVDMLPRWITGPALAAGVAVCGVRLLGDEEG